MSLKRKFQISDSLFWDLYEKIIIAEEKEVNEAEDNSGKAGCR